MDAYEDVRLPEVCVTDSMADVDLLFSLHLSNVWPCLEHF